MNIVKILELLNYGLVLLYGLFLSSEIAVGEAEGEGSTDERQQRKMKILFLALILTPIQILCTSFWDVETTRRLYPLIVHLPLVLVLIFSFKRPAGIAVVSVCTAYLCCELPRGGKLAVTALTGQAFWGELTYTALIVPIFFLLWRYFVRAAYNAMVDSPQSLYLFGSLPVVYYIFNYATTVYSNIWYAQNRVLNEFMPTLLILFYVAFLTAYRVQLQKRSQIETQSSLLAAQLRQADAELSTLHQSKTQSAIYQHDMRHHLTMIDHLLSTENPERAREYIKKVQTDIESVTPRPFCENELVNLLCSAFLDRAGHIGARLSVDARLPKTLPIPDTELCSVLSNGLENAIHAVSALEESQRNIELYCAIQLNKLLIEIRNPYAGEIVIQRGVPVSGRAGHGYGCRSIRTIAEQHGGLCSFKAENGIFQLRLMLPVSHSN
ncbi:MAG: GHKL domain-containing protein [Lachnospiraceae bacterium]|nr:GHKL domain-containing protein [Lachnospiraceae bacterium]